MRQNLSRGNDRDADADPRFPRFPRTAAQLLRDRRVLRGHRERQRRGEGGALRRRVGVAELFDVLQVRPRLGRTFTRDEETAGVGNVAMLSHSMWQDRYAGDPAIVGKAIRANGAPYTVVGVMPPKFVFPNEQAIWMPCSSTRPSSSAAAASGSRSSVVSSPACRSTPRTRTSTHRAAHRRGVQADERRRHGVGATDHREPDRPAAAPAALDDARRRLVRAAHCVRERGEPAARPRGASHEGSRHPHGARRLASRRR